MLLFVSFHNLSFAVETTKNETLLKKLGIHFDPTDKKITQEEMMKFYDKRTHKLKAHRHMGHATAAMMLASFFTARKARNDRDFSGAKKGNALKMHRNLSYVTALSYYATAYMSLTAPKPTVMVDESKRVWHKRMAYVHFPIMILAPIIGTIAYNQIKKDGETSGVGKLQKPVMYAGTLSFFAAYTVMTF